MSTNRPNRRRGLSLIELLAVVTILGLIAAIVVPRVSVARNRSQEAVGDHHIAQLNTLVEQHFLRNGVWPDTLADLEPLHFPEGIPLSPNGGTYILNSTTRRVEIMP